MSKLTHYIMQSDKDLIIEAKYVLANTGNFEAKDLLEELTDRLETALDELNCLEDETYAN